MKQANTVDKGQDKDFWKNTWENNQIESMIRKWDFWGLRQWILKYTPRKGKVLEAGCGLGRNNFYLESLGIDIDGLDFSGDTIKLLNKWAKANNFKSTFIEGDITRLPYNDSSLAGYLSFGVVEHFIEGPHKALNEAYRVLQPGGIAIITTPRISFHIFYCKIKNLIKTIIKKLIFFRKFPSDFVQYYYNPGQLKEFLEIAGFYVSRYSSADLLFAYCEATGFNEKLIRKGTFGYWFAQQFETSILNFLGAQSVTISIKVAEKMNCMICGKQTATPASLDIYDVPVCEECSSNNKEIAALYLKNLKVGFAQPYTINPDVLKPKKEICNFCGNTYFTDVLFEDFGFNIPVCCSCKKDPVINLKLSNLNLKPVWRP